MASSSKIPAKWYLPYNIMIPQIIFSISIYYRIAENKRVAMLQHYRGHPHTSQKGRSSLLCLKYSRE
jgi:hypothetical protein